MVQVTIHTIVTKITHFLCVCIYYLLLNVKQTTISLNLIVKLFITNTTLLKNDRMVYFKLVLINYT